MEVDSEWIGHCLRAGKREKERRSNLYIHILYGFPNKEMRDFQKIESSSSDGTPDHTADMPGGPVLTRPPSDDGRNMSLARHNSSTDNTLRDEQVLIRSKQFNHSIQRFIRQNTSKLLRYLLINTVVRLLMAPFLFNNQI